MKSTVALRFCAWLGPIAWAFSCPQTSIGNLIVAPPHSHAPSPVVTWSDGHVPVATHQHQHRTAHDPRAGVKDHGGAGPYVANKVWVNRQAVRLGGAHDFPNEFAHGHQDIAARYIVEPAAANAALGITQAEADAWNTGATDMIDAAFDAWMLVANASGDHNWPNDDNDEAPGTGVAWHSSIAWERVVSGDHELTISLGANQPNSFAITTIPLGHSSSGTMVFSNESNWFYGIDTDNTNHPNDYDFYSVALHEIGHVIGFDHFGTCAAGYVMNNDPGSVRSGACGILHTIDPDAVHGVRDLYAIAVPEPPSLLIAAATAMGLLRGVGRRRGHLR